MRGAIMFLKKVTGRHIFGRCKIHQVMKHTLIM